MWNVLGARNRHNAPFWVCRKALQLEHAISETVGQSTPSRPAKFRVTGPPDLSGHCWDLIDAPSVGRAITAILLHSAKPKLPVYHIALGRAPTIGEVVTAVCRATHRKGDTSVEELSAAELAEMCDTVDPNDRESEAVTGEVDIEALPVDHWLFKHPMEVKPMQDEFGWSATPLNVALKQYVQHLYEFEN